MLSDKDRPLHIALAAAPRLLADSLRSLLTDAGVIFVVPPDDRGEVFDVAIVTEGGPEVRAHLTIFLEEGPQRTGGAAVLDDRGNRLVLLDGLANVVEFVRAYVAR